MFAIEFSPAKIPPWVERVALPKYPAMPLASYVLLGLGVFLLLIGYFTPIKKLRTLLAGLMLVSYYPLSYLGHWILFRYDEQERALREPNKFEHFLFHHTYVLDWSVLGVCAFFGLLFWLWAIWATLKKRRRLRLQEANGAETALPASPVRPRATTAPPTRKAAKKPPAPPPSENPFNFG